MNYREWRRKLGYNQPVRLILLIAIFNVLAFAFQAFFANKNCPSTKISPSDVGPSLRLRSEREIIDYKNATKVFDWEKEQNELAQLVPVADIALTRESQPSNNLSALPPLDKHQSLKAINELLKANRLESVSTQLIVKYLKEKTILSCKQLDALEGNQHAPRLKHHFWADFYRRSKITIDDDKDPRDVITFMHVRPDDISYVTERPIKNPPNLSSAGVRFLHASDELAILLRMQGQPGIPRVYAACLRANNGTDVTDLGQGHRAVKIINYVLERLDNEVRVCPEDVYTTKCDDLSQITKMLKKHPKPEIATIKLLQSFTKVFRNLWSNGIFPYDLKMSHMVVTSNLDVKFTSLESFIALSTNENSKDKYERILSDVSCRYWNNCPTPGWQGQQVLFRYGQHCKEVKGYCSEDSRCWGMDSSVYLCTFAKWMFPKFHYLLPKSWRPYLDLKKLLACATQGKPEFRCSWISFERGLENIMLLARQTWS